MNPVVGIKSLKWRSELRLIVLGASAGGIDALMAILPELPKNFRHPMAAVVHCRPDRESGLAPIFDSRCRIRVKEAEDKELAQSGTLYFAPPDYHLLVEKDGSLSLSSDEAVMFSRPSIDVLFESAADAFGSGLMGIILTGANSDGSKGLNAICEAGGLGVVQRPDSALCPSMPAAALDSCPQALRLTVEEISEVLRDLSREEEQHHAE